MMGQLSHQTSDQVVRGCDISASRAFLSLPGKETHYSHSDAARGQFERLRGFYGIALRAELARFLSMLTSLRVGLFGLSFNPISGFGPGFAIFPASFCAAIISPRVPTRS